MLYRLAVLEARLSEPDRSSDNPAAIELQAHDLLRRRAPPSILPSPRTSATP